MTRCDVLVAGAGPAGMAAAAAAAHSGCNVVVVDNNPSPGGQIWRGDLSRGASPHGPHAAAFGRLAERLERAHVAVESGARIALEPAPKVLRIETESGCKDIGYQRLIVATGARELFLPFPGWTLPGVFGAGGLQALVKAGLPVAGKRVVLAGSGPLLLAAAAGLQAKGAIVAGIFEQAPPGRVLALGAQLMAHVGKLVEAVRYRAAAWSTPYKTSSWVVRAGGERQLRSVTISVRGKLREIACDFLGCGFHLVPNLELARLLGCRIASGGVAVDATQQTSVADVYCAGELTGIGGLDKALVEGEIAGLAAAGRSAAHLFAQRDQCARFARALSHAFQLRSELRMVAEETTLVCRCEDVAHGVLQSQRNWREAKLHTRCGMGACQGRICGAAAQFLYGWTPESVRPPLTPARMATLMADAPAVPAPGASSQ